MSDRAAWLSLEDAALLRQCAVDTYRAGGPGGQKRNKTASAVRLRHRPSGVTVIAGESRSPQQNKARAIKRLRAALALHVRQPMKPHAPPPDLLLRHRDAAGRVSISPRARDYWPLMACLLDALAATGGALRPAAVRLGLKTAGLSAALVADGKVLAAANRIRRANGLRPLKRSGARIV